MVVDLVKPNKNLLIVMFLPLRILSLLIRGSTPKLKSSFKSNSYTRKNIPVSFSPNTKSSSISITPKKQKKKKYTSMKKKIQIDKANAKLNFKTKSQQLQEDIQQLRDEKLKRVSI